jgi:hypothetical protein
MMEEIANMEHQLQNAFMPIGQTQCKWMEGVLLEHAITPIQQYSYTVGKILQILP